MSRKIATQQEKQVSFKRAFETLSKYKKNGEFLAAYVLAFSILEDRIRAMYVIRSRKSRGSDPSEDQVNGSITRIARSLAATDDIPTSSAAAIAQAARKRNHLIHAAMWNLNAISEEDIDAIVSLGRTADSLRKKQKRRLKM